MGLTSSTGRRVSALTSFLAAFLAALTSSTGRRAWAFTSAREAVELIAEPQQLLAVELELPRPAVHVASGTTASTAATTAPEFPDALLGEPPHVGAHMGLVEQLLVVGGLCVCHLAEEPGQGRPLGRAERREAGAWP